MEIYPPDSIEFKAAEKRLYDEIQDITENEEYTEINISKSIMDIFKEYTNVENDSDSRTGDLDSENDNPDTSFNFEEFDH